MRELFEKGDFVLWQAGIYLVLEDETDDNMVKIDHEDDHTDHFMISGNDLIKIKSGPWLEVLEERVASSVSSVSPVLKTMMEFKAVNDDNAKSVSVIMNMMDGLNPKDDYQQLLILNDKLQKASRKLGISRETFHNATIEALAEHLIKDGGS